MPDLQAIAREFILDYAMEAATDLLGIMESHDISEEAARDVIGLIRDAKITVSWD